MHGLITNKHFNDSGESVAGHSPITISFVSSLAPLIATHCPAASDLPS